MPADRPDGSPITPVVQFTPGPHPHMPHTVTGTMPDGWIYQPQEGRYVKDAETGITFGHAPCFTSELQAQLEQVVLKDRIGCFSFSLLDMPGYCGPVPDVKINLKHITQYSNQHGTMAQPSRHWRIRNVPRC